MTNLPRDPSFQNEDGARNGSSGPSYDVTIQGDVHLTPNDISELRKLADTHPDLAKQIVKDRREFVVLDNNTERLGMVLAVFLGFALVAGTSYTLVQLGWWQSIMFVGALLGISHVLRTILKGEFSDTSWFGQIMTGRPKKDVDGKTESEK